MKIATTQSPKIPQSAGKHRKNSIFPYLKTNPHEKWDCKITKKKTIKQIILKINLTFLCK
jgi:hypothetical protein